MGDRIPLGPDGTCFVRCDAPADQVREIPIPKFAAKMRAAFLEQGIRGEAKAFAGRHAEYLRIVSFAPFSVTWYRLEEPAPGA